MILFLMQFAKKIPFDDPTVLNAIRAVYLTSNVIIVSVYLYVQKQINKKRGVYTSRRGRGRWRGCSWPCSMSACPLTMRVSRFDDLEIRRTFADGLGRRTQARDDDHPRL